MITFTLRVVVPRKKHEEVLQTLRLILGPTGVQPDCLRCECYQDIRDENILLLMEEWSSQSALERHIRSEDYRKILAVMDLASEPPETIFRTVTHSDGMEVIQTVRGA